MAPSPPSPHSHEEDDTTGEWYTQRMIGNEAKTGFMPWVYTFLHGHHVRSVAPGRVLDVGCGIGNNLRHVERDSVGVDHNEHSVAEARARGLSAYTPDDFHARCTTYARSFDSILCAHVVEHVDHEGGVAMLADYLRYLKDSGRIVLTMPQEAGFRTDPTHVRMVDFDAARSLVETLGFTVERSYSWPLPRVLGPRVTSNEFVVVARLPT